MEITFLSASDGRSLTKKFTRPNKKEPIIKHSYPHVARFTSRTANITNLKGLLKAITFAGNRGECLSKSLLLREIENESRAGTTNPDQETELLVADLDGLYGFSDVEQFLAAIGLPDVSYVLQYSASMGILDDSLNAHIFMLIDKPVSPQLIKQWITYKNLTTPEIRSQITLTKSYNALKWPFDRTVNQNDKLIYIAPPELYDGIKDPFSKNRITIVHKDNERVDSELFSNFSPEVIEAESIMVLNKLRKDKGLPAKRKVNSKQYKGEIVMANPSRVTITGHKEDRGFVYLNFNGGDSWGYYFPKANPEVVKNFKGEDNYALKDIAPEFYAEMSREANTYIREQEERKLSEATEGKSFLAFTDKLTDQYHVGHYDHDTGKYELRQTSSVLKIQHFLRDNEQFVPDYIPEWTYGFDFKNPNIFDPKNRFINRYQISSYLQEALEELKDDTHKLRTIKTTRTFPTISRVIKSVCGDSAEAVNRFTNWFAYIIQRREPARTAWLMHGIQGTGKGILFNYIISPIVGHRYVQVKRLEEIEDNFNGFMHETLFLMIDEIQISNAKNRNAVMAKIKNLITEPTVSIRAMRTDSFMVENNVNLILASNMPDPIEIDPSDRRINVADYQDNKLEITHDDIIAIEEELFNFTKYILSYKVDVQAARTPMESESREHLKYLTRSTIDLFSDALRDGDIIFFFTMLSSEKIDPVHDSQRAMTEMRMKLIVHKMMIALKNNKTSISINREDLIFMAQHIIGKIPETTAKFTNYVKHHGINIKPIKDNGKTTRGVVVKNLHAPKELIKEWFKVWSPDIPSPKPDLKLVKRNKNDIGIQT